MNNKGLDQATSKTSQEKSEGGFIDVARIVSLLVLLVGAAGSLAYMFREGQQTPRLLLILFTIWIFSPFAALLWAHRLSNGWSVLTRGTLYCATVIVGLCSLAIYGEWVNVRPPGSANAFLFVAVPPLSLIFTTIVVLIAALISGRRSRRSSS